ncbi:MAG: hypothetical protein LBE06_03280, partial [Azoarcus sp.]|nr:hypothetical protein [Azoarcus sp.]
MASVPCCFLCHKLLWDPDNGVDEGDGVSFADYVEPEGSVEEFVGYKEFCDVHYPAAQALSHLTSEEALRQLEEQFGTFPPLPYITEEFSRWEKLYDALFEGPFNSFPCALCHRDYWQGIAPLLSGGYFEFADSKVLHFCGKHWLLARSLSHL